MEFHYVLRKDIQIERKSEDQVHLLLYRILNNPNSFLICFLVREISVVIIPCLFRCWHSKYENEGTPCTSRIYWSYKWPQLKAGNQQEVLVHKPAEKNKTPHSSKKDQEYKHPFCTYWQDKTPYSSRKGVVKIFKEGKNPSQTQLFEDLPKTRRHSSQAGGDAELHSM